MGDTTFEAIWSKGFDGFFTTEFDAPDEPSYSEAAQVIGVIENENPAEITVSSIMEVGE